MEVGENYGHFHGKDFRVVTTALQRWFDKSAIRHATQLSWFDMTEE